MLKGFPRHSSSEVGFEVLAPSVLGHIVLALLWSFLSSVALWVPVGH